MRKDFQTKTMILNGKRVKVSVPRKLSPEERIENLKKMERLFKKLVFAE